MGIQETLKRSCTALCHWATYNHYKRPEYHINEGAVVYELASLISSIDRENKIRISHEKLYNDIECINKSDDFENTYSKNRFDIWIECQSTVTAIEVKQEFSLRNGGSFPCVVMDDIKKLTNLIRSVQINTEKTKFFVVYLTQQSQIRKALTEDGMARTKFDEQENQLDNDVKIKLRHVAKSISSFKHRKCGERDSSSDSKESLIGEYCYLFEIVPKKKN